MPVYKIRVNTKEDGGPMLMTIYDTEAPNRDDAAKKARRKFCEIYGFEYCNTETYCLWNEARQQDDYEYLKAHGLPDEIPS